jgi:CBS domain-containing protein
MLVKDVMVNGVAVCWPEANLAEVAAILWDARCGTLPVVDGDGRVISMITDRDIAIALGTRNLRACEVKVKDVAPPRVFTCAPDDDFEDALNTMTTQNVRRLPVVEDGKLVGILSIDDLARNASAWPDDQDIPESNVIVAIRKILSARNKGRIRRPAELLASRG